MKIPCVGDVMINYDTEYFEGAVFGTSAYSYDTVSTMMEEYGRKMWNAALEWAAENANSNTSYGGGWGSDVSIVDKQSILKGKL